jgi:D-alanine-D-alanine ligase
MRKNIAVLAGGDSSEAGISHKSADQICSILDKDKYNVYRINVRGADWILSTDKYYDIKINRDDFSFSDNKRKTFFDCALIAIHGSPGENGLLQAYFELLEIPYTTSDQLSSAITFNKYACKMYLRDTNIPMAKSVLIRKNKPYQITDILKTISIPCFVKPNNGGSSYGTSKVKSKNQLEPAIKTGFKEDNELLIEEFIPGTEITCGIFKTPDKEIIFPLTEIVPKKDFFDVEAKYQGASEEITPARIPKDLSEKCKKLSSQIYDTLNCRGICRIDFILKKKDFYFLEINTVPGMSEASIIPQQVKAMGMDITELFTMLIEDSILRMKGKK